MGVDFVILGATGMQGKIAARDLLENDYSVLLCGRNEERLQHILKRYKKSSFAFVDLRDVAKTTAVLAKSGASIVLNCAEGDWNLNALNASIKAGCSCLDLGSEIWMTKKQLALDSVLHKKKLIHITGCGSVPGIGNVMLRYAARELDKVESIDVGFAWNSNIKKFVVPFSIQSIIEEFTDPAPEVLKKKFIKVRPLSTLRKVYNSAVGEEERLLVRHPETYTFFHYYKNKGVSTIKFFAEFPPHSFEKIKTMIELGMGSKKPIQFQGREIVPVQFLTEVLKGLPVPKGYTEKEDLWVDVIGSKAGKQKVNRMHCIVPTLPGWEDAGCNIDTGMTVSIMAQMILREEITQKGSFAPEGVVPPEPFFAELAKRKMIVYENKKRIN